MEMAMDPFVFSLSTLASWNRPGPHDNARLDRAKLTMLGPKLYCALVDIFCFRNTWQLQIRKLSLHTYLRTLFLTEVQAVILYERHHVRQLTLGCN